MTPGFRAIRPSLRRHGRDLSIALIAAAGSQVIGIPLALLTRGVVNRAAGGLDVGAESAPLYRMLWTFGLVFAGLVLLLQVYGLQVLEIGPPYPLPTDRE